jgi:hypothetical protein
VEVELWARLWDDVDGWGDFAEPDNDLSKGMDVGALIGDFGEGEVPLIFYERATEYSPGDPFPSKGKLWIAQYTEADGWTPSLLDEGTPGVSNTGRNLSAIWEDGLAHLAYYDLHSPGYPSVASLRYASYDGASFSAEDAMNVAIPDGGHTAALYYYHTPGIALVGGEPALATFSRLSNPPAADVPFHLADLYFCRYDGGGWANELVVEDVAMYLHFNVAVQVTGDGFAGYPLLVFPTGPEETGGADHLEIWQRGPLIP